jgi:hypothetical protein
MALGSSTKKDMVTALFDDRHDAEKAYSALLDAGIREDDLSIVMSDETRGRHYSDGGQRETEMGNKATEGAGVGGAVGGTIGGIAGAIAAAAAPVVFPGIGIVLSGPLAAALAGAGAGGLGGSIVGGLVGAGIPEERVKHYETGIREGSILLGASARTPADADTISDVFKRYGGKQIHR